MHNNISGDSSLFGGLFFFYIEEEITRVKKLTNMTTHSFDLERFGNNAGLKEFLRRHSLDGLELMEIGEDEKQIFKKKMWSVFIGSIIPAGIVSGKKTPGLFWSR